MSFINVVNLTFAYEGSYDNIFEQVSFRMDTDWRLGFTGRNGRGKTTFLRLLMDLNEPVHRYEYEGTISASVNFEYFPYHVENPEQMTLEIAGQILPGCEEPENIWKVFRELSLLEVEPEVLYRPFMTLSHGEQTKVLLALLFLRENSFLLIDEPTNHLDSRAREILGEYLKKKSGFILVSHDRRLLDTCVDHVLAINKTNIEIQKGNFSSWWENKKRQDEFELAENERLRKDISKLRAAAKQSRDWADKVESTKIGHKHEIKFATIESIDNRAFVGEKSRRMQMRRKNLERRQERAIDEKSGLLKNLEDVEQIKLFPLEYRAERIAMFENVSVFYGEKQIFGDLNLEICRGDRIALSGKNGCGKSSLIKLILELQKEKNDGWQGGGAVRAEKDAGGFGVGAGESGLSAGEPGVAVDELGVSTGKPDVAVDELGVSAGKPGVAIDHPAPDNTKDTGKQMRYTGKIQLSSGLILSYVPQDTGFLRGNLKDFAGQQEIDAQLFMTLLRKLDFSRIQLEKNMEEYSEGQKKKVLLAASLVTRAHLYIWDEPLNYIDVFSRMQMEELILKYRPTLLFVEHDREFTGRIATKEIRFAPPA